MKITNRKFTVKKAPEWASHLIKDGADVYEFHGNTYSCVRDDSFEGIESMAMTTDPNGIEGPFFTVPVSDLETTDGGPKPRGPYAR